MFGSTAKLHSVIFKNLAPGSAFPIHVAPHCPDLGWALPLAGWALTEPISAKPRPRKPLRYKGTSKLRGKTEEIMTSLFFLKNCTSNLVVQALCYLLLVFWRCNLKTPTDHPRWTALLPFTETDLSQPRFFSTDIQQQISNSINENQACNLLPMNSKQSCISWKNHMLSNLLHNLISAKCPIAHSCQSQQQCPQDSPQSDAKTFEC